MDNMRDRERYGMTLAELMFSAAFVIMMNSCAIFALLCEKQGLRTARAIIAFFGRTLLRSFPASEEGQTASQARPTVSVVSQPVVRLVS